MTLKAPKAFKKPLAKVLAVAFLCAYLLLPLGKPVADALHFMSHKVSDFSIDGGQQDLNRHSHDHFSKEQPAHHHQKMLDEPTAPLAQAKLHDHPILGWFASIIDLQENTDEGEKEFNVKVKWDKHVNPCSILLPELLGGFLISKLEFVLRFSNRAALVPAPPPRT